MALASSEPLPRFVWQRRALARRADTTSETLSRLAASARSAAAVHKQSSVRMAVAGNRNAFPRTLAILAQDPDAEVRRAAAANPHTPLPARAALTQDVSADVRAKAERSDGIPHRFSAAKSSPPASNVFDLHTADEAIAALVRGDQLSYYTRGDERPEVLFVLAHSAREDLRDYVLNNAHTDAATLDFLASFVTLDVVPSKGPDRAIAKHRNSSPQVLERLAGHSSSFVREEVASNVNTPTRVLDTLATDTSLMVIRSVAGNRHTSTSTLRKLSVFPDTPKPPVYLTGSMAQPYHDHTSGADIRRAVAGNPQSPEVALSHLAQHGYASTVAGNPTAPAAVLHWIAKHKRNWKHSTTIRDVAAHANTPTAVLDRLADNWESDEYVCEAVAENPNTPTETLLRLRENGAYSVRDAASQALSEREKH